MRVVFLALLVGCSAATPAVVSPADRGPHPVGTRTLLLTDAERNRQLPVEVWYPAVDSARDAETAGEPITAMITMDENKARYEALLASAPAE